MTIHHEPNNDPDKMESLNNGSSYETYKNNLTQQFNELSVMVVKIRHYIEENGSDPTDLGKLQQENERLMEIIEELSLLV